MSGKRKEENEQNRPDCRCCGNAGLTKKDTERVLNAALDAISLALVRGEKVQLSGFGTFESKTREARIGRNPHTNEAIEIPATRVPAFKASKALKDNIAK